MSSSQRTGITLVMAVATVAAGAFVVWLVTGTGHGKSPSRASATANAPRTSGSSSPTPTYRGAKDSDEACGGDPFNARKVLPYSPGGPAYAGAGPHPALFFKGPFFAADDQDEPQLAKKWQPFNYATQTQLLICQYEDPSYHGRQVDTCTYVDNTDNADGGTRTTAAVRAARYVYRVFEAKTARLITTFTLKGSGDPCPAFAHQADAAGDFDQTVSSKALEDRLRPLLTDGQ